MQKDFLVQFRNALSQIGTVTQPALSQLRRAASIFTLVQIFLFFNLSLVIGVGGLLYLLRSHTSRYSAVEMDVGNIILMTVVCGFTLLLYIALVLIAQERTKLQNSGALIVAAGFLEILGFVFLTHRVFTYVPTTHLAENKVKIEQYLQNERKKLPLKVSDYVTLVSELHKGRMFIMSYKLKEREGYSWDEKTMRDGLIQESCQRFADFSGMDIVTAIDYSFSMNDKPLFNFVIRKKDCDQLTTEAPKTPAPSPNSFQKPMPNQLPLNNKTP